MSSGSGTTFYFGTKPEWIMSLQSWANAEPYVARVWLFGSRVTGIRRPKSNQEDEPDLDVAYEMEGAEPGELLAHSILFSDRWRRELASSIPVTLDLQQADENDVMVLPTVRDHGVLIFDRSQPYLRSAAARVGEEGGQCRNHPRQGER